MAPAQDRDVAKHYKLPSAFPDEWPADLDETSAESGNEHEEPDEDEPNLTRGGSKMNRRKSKYHALNQENRRKSFLPGAAMNGSMGSSKPSGRMNAQMLERLVASNFERFVRAKATVDNVYFEMRNQGSQDPQNPDGPSKYALKEASEYGVQSIRLPLEDVVAKAEEVWGPALQGRQREEELKSVINAMERHRPVFELGDNLRKSIRLRDFHATVDQYNRARRFASDAKILSDRAQAVDRELKKEEVHMILVIGRMWSDAKRQIDAFVLDLWKCLSNYQGDNIPGSDGPIEEYMEIIITLLEIGVEDNPVWVWLCARYAYLNEKTRAFCNRFRMRIETLRRQLANAEKPRPQTLATFLRYPSSDPATGTVNDKIDMDAVVDMWDCVSAFLKKLLSPEGGLLGEVLDFWETIKSFIGGEKQKLLPSGFEGQSRKHHNLSEESIADLRDGVLELMDLIRTNVSSLLGDAPIEDISSLVTQVEEALQSQALFRSETREVPDFPARNGEFWEDFAFWPPYSNSLSAAHYLSDILILIGSAASHMASSSVVSNSPEMHDQLKVFVNTARERCVNAICAAWDIDAGYSSHLETWTRDPEQKDMTTTPCILVAFEDDLLAAIQKILYISDAMTKPQFGDIVSPPSSELLLVVREQFAASIYKTFTGMVDNAEDPLQAGSAEVVSALSSPHDGRIHGVDFTNKNVRMLLTLSNFRYLRSDYIPHLINYFERSFGVPVSEEANEIYSTLDQIDSKIFEFYTNPTAHSFKRDIIEGITAPDWAPSTGLPSHIRPYVSSVMLQLVMVHAEISTTLPLSSMSQRPSSLTAEIMSHLLHEILRSMEEAFQLRPKYTSSAMMQATLETEFIVQTLSQYVTEDTSRIQGSIYSNIGHRTQGSTRSQLEQELEEVRSVLKRLRENTRGEFACFRKVKPLNAR